MFAKWGRFVYRRRWAILVFSALLLAASVAAFVEGGSFAAGKPTLGAQSTKAAELLSKELGGDKKTGSSFQLIFRSSSQSSQDPTFKDAVTAALAPIQFDPRVSAIASPYNAPSPAVAQALTSRDGHEVLVQVDLKSTGQQAKKDYAALRREIQSGSLSVTATGQVPINRAFDTTLESDLNRAEDVSLPISLVLLLIIFGTVIAAGLPLGVGLLTIIGGMGATLLMARFTDVSQYAQNIVTFIGLAVAIDYSLFVVNRFRDELAAGLSREDAIANTMATAGRAITFSGITVAIGLSSMLFYVGSGIDSVGAAGAIVVSVAVLYGLTFLPAVLSLLGPRVNRLRLPTRRATRPGRGVWHGLATRVMRRPLLVLLPTVAFLVLVASPFLQMRMAQGGVDQLPSRIEARQGYDRLIADFPGQDQTTFDVVVSYPDGSPLTRDRIGDQYDLDRRIAAIPGVLHTTSIYNADANLDRADYQNLYTTESSQRPEAVWQAVAQSVGKHIVLIQATSGAQATSDEARAIVRAIRADRGVGHGGEVLVGGFTAEDMDSVNFITGRTPLAVGFAVLATYLILFLLTGSVVLPLKAVLLNLLSIGASFGALVWIFQQGHLSAQLGFSPQSIDPSTPVILFSIVFGMSMDYEVLLVSRIHEEYQRTGNNTASVARGLELSGRLITGAAAIMVAVFLCFGLAEVVLIKAIGLGLAIAVAMDATVVRALVVPAVMRILGDVTWWAPRPLRRLHESIGIGETGSRRPAPAGAPLSPAA